MDIDFCVLEFSTTVYNLQPCSKNGLKKVGVDVSGCSAGGSAPDIDLRDFNKIVVTGYDNSNKISITVSCGSKYCSVI